MKYSLRSLTTFSIRDLALETVIVDLGFGWLEDRLRLTLENNAALTQAVELEDNARIPARHLPKSSAPDPNPPIK